MYKGDNWVGLNVSPRYGWLSLLLAVLRERQRSENVAALILPGEHFQT